MERLILGGVLMGLISASMGYDFYVGGKDGWVLKPSESYSSWAGRNRFQVNDRLVFKYKKGEDSVLVVKKEDYDSCNVTNPIQKLEGGDSVFQFDRSGPFYFISGVPGRCSKGEKLMVVVLAVRNKKPIPPPASSAPSLNPSPAPPLKPPTSSPSSSPVSSPSPSSTPVSSPVSSPSPSSTPVSSPVSSPSPSSSPVSSPVPSSSPSSSPVSAPSPSSSSVPTTSPSSAPSSPPAPSPGAQISPPAGPGASPSQSPTSVNGSGAPETSPSSQSSSATALTVSTFLIGLLGLVLGNTILN